MIVLVFVLFQMPGLMVYFCDCPCICYTSVRGLTSCDCACIMLYQGFGFTFAIVIGYVILGSTFVIVLVSVIPVSGVYFCDCACICYISVWGLLL